MSKRHVFLISFLLLGFSSLQAQSERWANTQISDLANAIVNGLLPAPTDSDSGYIVLTTDTTIFLYQIDEFGQEYFWHSLINKPDVSETAGNVVLIPDLSGYFVFATIGNGLPWVVQTDITGNIVDVSDIWSDLLPDNSFINTIGEYASPLDIIVAGFDPVNLELNIAHLNATASSLTTINTYPLPVNPGNQNILPSIVQYTDSSVLLAINDSISDPVIVEVGASGSITSQITIDDSIFINALTPSYEDDFLIAGNKYDSSAIYLSRIDSMGTSPILFDVIYPISGHKVIATDVLELPDTTYLVATTHFFPFGLRTIIMHFDTDGEYITEDTILDNAGDISLQKFTSHEGTYPVAMGGYVNAVDADIDELIVRSDAFGVFPLCIYNCVWPGDADYNGIVNMEDLLYIGVAYGSTGDERDSISDYWQSYLPIAWDNVFATGLNVNYANCNGDNIINDNDTSSIVLNYNLSHLFFPLREGGGEEYPIWLNTAGIIIDEGYNEIPIMLGTEEIPVDDIYGLQFTIGYEGPFIIDSTTVKITFDDSWLGTASVQLLQLDKNFATDRRITAGVTRIDQNNTSGYGQIGRLSFVVEDNIEALELSDTIIIFNIQDATGITNILEPVSLDASSYSAIIAGIYNDPASESTIRIFPNPVSENHFNLISSENLNHANWKITDVTGRMVCTGIIINNSITIPVEIELSNQEYILSVTSDTHFINYPFIYFKN